MLDTNPIRRPSCEKILNFSIFNDLRIFLQEAPQNTTSEVFNQNDLIRTIRANENFLEIEKSLP